MRKKETVSPELLKKTASDATCLPAMIKALGGKGTARFAVAKDLQLISRECPDILYPYFDDFAKLLDNPSSVLLWNSIIILSRLATVDTKKRFDAVFEGYFRHLWDGKLVTAANILGNSGIIAKARPDLANRVITEVLKVDTIPLPTTECREVARGAALSAIGDCLYLASKNQSVLDFLHRCASSHRPSVKKQAKALLDTISK